MDNFNSNACLGEAFYCLTEASPDAIILKDNKGGWLFANEHALSLFELDSTDWQGKTGQALFAGKADLQKIYELCTRDDEFAWLGNGLLAYKEFFVDSAGNERAFEIRKTPVFSNGGIQQGIIIIYRDITERFLDEQNLRIADMILELHEPILITDEQCRIVRVNGAFTRTTGFYPEEVIGRKTSAFLKSGFHDKAFYQVMWTELKDKKYWQGEVWDRHKDGGIYPKWLTIAAVTCKEGEVSHYIGIFSDISKQKQAEETMHRLAFYDPLTNLPNRRLLYSHLEQSLGKDQQGVCFGAVLMIDIDHFKLINDTKGHAVGDLLLIEVAQRLKSCVGNNDIVARLGGDEFVIILKFPESNEKQATMFAEAMSKKILRVVNKPFMIAGHRFHSSLSVGISIFTSSTSNCEEILKHADTAMYQAKFAGRNTMRFFDPEMLKILEYRMSLEQELHHALSMNQFKLHYQVQVDNKHHALGAEVLLRWQHPKLGLIPPVEFIPIAEETGMILPIGEWVLKSSCVQLKLWENNPLTEHLTLAVNVSARQFAQADFVEKVCKILKKTGARATQLKLELTESLILQNVENAIEKMETLKLLGIRFSMDDFGTGYSSLSYLKRLPINQLKIDRSFVDGVDSDANDALIAQTIIGMGNILGFQIIAEGVETEAQRTRLEQFGCYAYQGYLFGRPMPINDFQLLLRGISDRGVQYVHQMDEAGIET